MNFNWKMIILVLILAAFFWINWKYSNVFVKVYNKASQVPKLLIIFFGIILLVAPALVKNNTLIDYFKDYLPESVTKRIDSINELMPEKQTPIDIVQQVALSRGIPDQDIYFPTPQNNTTRSRRKVSEQEKKIVGARQYWKCLMCNQMLDETFEVDHIRALEDGGTNHPDNLQALCRNCHGKKTVKDNIKRKYEPQ